MTKRIPVAAFLAALILVFSVDSVLAQGKSDQSNGNKFGVGKPDKISDLPPGQLKKTLKSLPKGVQKKALAWLQEMDFPEQDVNSLRANLDGDIYYADFEMTIAADPLNMAEGPVIMEALPDVDLFTLHSKPGSSNVVYLDFDGHVVSGTAWNVGRADPLIALPFDASYNDSPATVANFTDEERKRIHEIWFRISEDYAPFDIDVTTEEPVVFTNTTGRVLFTHDRDANNNPMPAEGAGGVAYSPVFGWSNYASYYSPAFVYYTNLYSNYPYHGDATLNAEAGAHEFGHNLSLGHDSYDDGVPDNYDEYYDGHGTGWVRWGPVMGGSYGDSVTQWSSGEYPNATNSQDDIAVITSRLGLSADDVPDSAGSAASQRIVVEADGEILVSDPEIDPDNSYPENKGVIGTRTDVDWWYVDVETGPLSITVTPSWQAFNTSDYRSSVYRGNNLDVKVELYDSALNLVTSDDPIDNTDATVSTSATAGRYFIQVDGVGNADGIGYTDYGSMGTYYITGSVEAATPGPECSETMTLSAGEVKAFALPCDPGNATVAEVFTTFDMNAMGGAWGIYYVDNAAKQPVILTPDSTLPVGVFYAISSNLDTTVTVHGNNIPAMNIPLTESSMQVGEGDWNFIGYTGRASRSWAEVIPMEGPDNKDWSWADKWRNNLDSFLCDLTPVDTDCRIRRVMHKWSGSSFEPYEPTGANEGTLEPWDAFLVEAFEANTGLHIPQTLAAPAAPSAAEAIATGTASTAAASSSQKASKSKSKTKDWYVRLSAESGRYKDKGNAFGQLKDSSDGQDSHDLEEMPPISSTYLTILYDNPEFEASNWGYSTDLRALTRSAGGEWNMSVRASQDIETVTLKWKGDADILARMTLTNELSGETIEAGPSGSYTFTMPPGGENPFRITVE